LHINMIAWSDPQAQANVRSFLSHDGNKPSDPGNACPFGSPGIVFPSDYLTNLIQQSLEALSRFLIESHSVML